MIRSTTVNKNGGRFRFLDDLFGGQEEGVNQRKEISYLIDDYIAFLNIAAKLTAHSRWIPYPFVVERTKKIADELRSFAEVVRAKIAELGGQVPQDPLKFSTTHDGSDDGAHGLQNRNGNELVMQNIKRLVTDMEEHSSRYETLYHQRNLIADAGTVKFLNQIIVDMQRQKSELLNIVMRIS